MQLYITGPAGSGKSTLAKKLGEELQIPVIHLDELLWSPDGTENPKYSELQKKAVQERQWIIEGPSCSIVSSMISVDCICILHYHPIGNIWRIISRRIHSILGTRNRIGAANLDSISLDFLMRTAIWNKRQLPRLLEKCKQNGLMSKVVYIHDFSTAHLTLRSHLEDMYVKKNTISIE